MATSSSSSSSTPSLFPHHLAQFTPIEEGNEDEELSQGISSFLEATGENYSHKKEDVMKTNQCRHQHGTSSSEKRGINSTRKRSGNEEGDTHKWGVSCNNCRPSNKEKIFIVQSASPIGIFKNIFSYLVKKSPKSVSADETSTTMSREDQWKATIEELSHKLIEATRKRDEAVTEVSRLKYSMSELEKKVNKLEIYSQNLKSNLEFCSNNSSQQEGSDIIQGGLHLSYSKSIKSSVTPFRREPLQRRWDMWLKSIKVGDEDKVIEHFLVEISEARSSIRLLSRSLTLQLKQQIEGKVLCDKIALHLQPYDVKMSSLSRSIRALQYYLEALLNKSFFEDFESIGLKKNAHTQILNPIDRCEANFASFGRLKGLTWEEVLNEGTNHFSEEFSKFCDRKMSEIVAMLGWNRAWSEPLLHVFFSASKAVWLVHLLANSVHPNFPIFRVDKDVRFDSVYMEDIGGDRAKKLVPTMVNIMVTPGFYVYDSVVKCKVICRYCNSNITSFQNGGLTQPPS